jgi:hypothetical protein
MAGANLMSRLGEEFPLECLNCSGDIRLSGFVTDLERYLEDRETHHGHSIHPRLPHHPTRPTATAFLEPLNTRQPGQPTGTDR